MKQYVITLTLVILWGFGLNASRPIVLPLWPGASTDSLHSDYIPELTVYVPQMPCGTAVVMCPGGGYTHLALSQEGHDMAGWFNERGIVYGVVNYRMPGGDSRLPLADAREAMKLMRGHAEEWGVDSTRIGIMGASAGGHLASCVATMWTDEPDSRPDFQVLFYPVISMEPGVTHKGSRKELIGADADEGVTARWSTNRRVAGTTPPAFIMLAADDKAVPVTNSLLYFYALRSHGVPAELHIYPSGGHGWGFRDSFKYKQDWTRELERWLNELNP